MARTSKVDAKAYYDFLPQLHHECGDIWSGLPSFGLLGDGAVPGIVITPACDLSWQKSDTLTYLPIIPLTAFFSLDAALPTAIEKLKQGAEAAGCPAKPDWSAETFLSPSSEELDSFETEITAFRAARQHSAKTLAALDRVSAAIDVLRVIRQPECKPIAAGTLAQMFGSEWPKTKEKLLRNSYSPALHFLPRDEQNILFSGVNTHSVALFRCPITVPVKVMNHAIETPESLWSERIMSLGLSGTIKTAFRPSRPVKMLSLRQAFLSDLLTRFSALYNRVGSPDFSDETVNRYSSEVS